MGLHLYISMCTCRGNQRRSARQARRSWTAKCRDLGRSCPSRPVDRPRPPLCGVARDGPLGATGGARHVASQRPPPLLLPPKVAPEKGHRRNRTIEKSLFYFPWPRPTSACAGSGQGFLVPCSAAHMVVSMQQFCRKPEATMQRQGSYRGKEVGPANMGHTIVT